MQQKKTVTASLLFVALWVVLALYYYNTFGLLNSNAIITTFYKLHEKDLDYNLYRKMSLNNETEDFLINTPGCSIPFYQKDISFKEAKQIKDTCKPRIVFYDKISDNTVRFRISSKYLKKDKFECCYKFAARSSHRGKEDFALSYSKCTAFKNKDEIKLKEEVVLVSCVLLSENNTQLFTYQDAYLILIKKTNEDLVHKAQDTGENVTSKWNVLLLGVDTMSRARAYKSLPKTVQYLRHHQWLDYRGYQKVASNTFPNLMALLTGKNQSSVNKDCIPGMDNCKEELIWSKFRKAGYVTAFAEDNLQLPDTFGPYHGFTVPPTDHYARPLFLTGEHLKGNRICTKSEPSGVHILDYAKQFSETYKNDSFFGMFWINTVAHNLNYLPMLYEDELIDFFEALQVLNRSNTFVIFLSDHGQRFGPNRVSNPASYYEERLPMLFIWVPYDFREQYPDEYYNLQINQYRLVTPYDLHATLWRIMKMSRFDIDLTPPEGCPKCKSLTKEISLQRTCDDAGVEEKWCSCHNMTKTIDKNVIQRSVETVISAVRNKSHTVEIKKCFKCSPFKLLVVQRHNWYTRGNKTYYIIALILSPSNLAYEAKVEHYKDDFRIVGSIDTLVGYHNRGSCVVSKPWHKAYCVCVQIKNCK